MKKFFSYLKIARNPSGGKTGQGPVPEYKNRPSLWEHQIRLLGPGGNSYSQVEPPPPQLPSDIIAGMEVSDDKVFEFRFSEKNPEDMKGRLLVLAYYPHPQNSGGENLDYFDQISRIGGDLPSKYIIGRLNVYHEWILDALDRQERAVIRAREESR